MVGFKACWRRRVECRGVDRWGVWHRGVNRRVPLWWVRQRGQAEGVMCCARGGERGTCTPLGRLEGVGVVAGGVRSGGMGAGGAAGVGMRRDGCGRRVGAAAAAAGGIGSASGSPATTDSPATSASALSSPSHSTSGSGGSSSGQGGGVLGKRASGGGVLWGRVAGARAAAASRSSRARRAPPSALASRLAAVLNDIQSKPAPPFASAYASRLSPPSAAASLSPSAPPSDFGVPSASAAAFPALTCLDASGARGTEEEQAAAQGGVASGGAAGGEMMVVGGRVRGMDSFGFTRASALIGGAAGGTGGAAGFGSGTGGGGSSYAVARELLEALPGGATGLDDLQSLQPPGSRRRTSGLYGVGAVSLDYRDAVSFNESGYSGSGCWVPWGAWEGGASGMSDQLIKGMGENAARGGNAAVAALSAAWWEARGQVGALEFPRPTAGPVSVEVTGPDVSGKFRSVEKFARAQMVAMAEAAEAGDTGRFHSAFVQLKPLGKVRGNAVERLTHYVLEGLMRRMAGTGFQHFCTPLRRPPKELDEALTLYASSQPFPLFASISVAGLVAEAVSGSTHVHIVDFGCFQPIHLPVLMDLLASRPGGPPSLRLTGMDTASFICAGRKDFKRLRAMEDVGRRLRGVARHLGVPFEFESVNVDEDNLQLLYQVKRQWHETLVVVCALELLLLPDSPNGPRHCVLRWIHDMHPTLFTFCDVDLDTNHSAFLPRFQDIVDHHLATFQFHDVFLGNADKRLLSVFEEIYFARSIINGIACEGDERVVRSERAGQWRKRLLLMGEVGPKDVRIRITHCGICHSDLHQVKNEWGGSQYPMVPGHEIAGVVEAVGSEVTRVAVGQRAGIGCMVDSCRTCQPCVQHVEQFCPQCVYTYNKVDPKTGESTQGGYSSFYVCDQDFVLTIPDKLPSDVAAPLLCAGITVYSPMVYYGINQAGKRLGVVGLGGLGHMAVKFGKAFGMHVTVLSTSPSKEKEAKEVMCADEFIVTKDADAMKAAVGTLDAIVDTVSAQHDLAPYLDLLTFNGKMILVGVPPEPYGLHAGQLIFGRKTVAGSLIGGIKETQEMLEFCAEKGVAPMIEKIDIQDVNKAYERMLKNDVKYRFVIEIEKSLK
ncbi:unnamed protein product [Closterium sp. NIES-65]|nr:unnamed protein product [Closterium sp. NIES-65]